MAPVLVCPDCSTKHPLPSIGERAAFPCEGCGRTLKVPAAAMAGAAATPPRAPAPQPEPMTRAMPVAESLAPMPATAEPPTEPRERERAPRDPIPPRGIRFLLWIVAIPLAFVVVLTFARAAGMLTTNEISDVALAQGWGRFWPIARLIPFVALAAAAFVQGGAILLTRWRRRRWAELERAAALEAAGTPRPRTNGARPRNQSSRTRA